MAKFNPSTKLALAIAKLEEQCGGELPANYGTAEHMAIVRYLVAECCNADGVLDKDALKREFGEASSFIGYASNAKKLLQDAGLIGKDKSGGYV